jgi:hypothetical protein
LKKVDIKLGFSHPKGRKISSKGLLAPAGNGVPKNTKNGIENQNQPIKCCSF